MARLWPWQDGVGGGAVVGEMPGDKSKRLGKKIRVCRWNLCVEECVRLSRGRNNEAASWRSPVPSHQLWAIRG